MTLYSNGRDGNNDDDDEDDHYHDDNDGDYHENKDDDDDSDDHHRSDCNLWLWLRWLLCSCCCSRWWCGWLLRTHQTEPKTTSESLSADFSAEIFPNTAVPHAQRSELASILTCCSWKVLILGDGSFSYNSCKIYSAGEKSAYYSEQGGQQSKTQHANTNIKVKCWGLKWFPSFTSLQPYLLTWHWLVPVPVHWEVVTWHCGNGRSLHCTSRHNIT